MWHDALESVHQAIQRIRESQRIRQRGSPVEIRWVPGHAGAEGNEKADLRISGAARMSEGVCEGGDISLAALRAVRARKANDMWRDEIKRRNKGRGIFRCSGGGLRP